MSGQNLKLNIQIDVSLNPPTQIGSNFSRFLIYMDLNYRNCFNFSGNFKFSAKFLKLNIQINVSLNSPTQIGSNFSRLVIYIYRFELLEFFKFF